jgi:hypothetical protein
LPRPQKPKEKLGLWQPLHRPHERGTEAPRSCAADVHSLSIGPDHDLDRLRALRRRFGLVGMPPIFRSRIAHEQRIDLYSTNPWFAIDVATKYRKGIFFAWVCEYFDSSTAPARSAGAIIAPSSNPRKIYEDLLHECSFAF